MLPKNIKIDRMNGRLFVPSENGYQPLGSLYEAEITEETEETEEAVEPWPEENPYLLKQQQAATFTAETRISHDVVASFKTLGAAATELVETLEILWSFFKRVVELYERYPNRRVKHLALYAKKLRTRKKNMRRIGRELKKEAKT